MLDSSTIEAMHEQVRLIYRAATGSALSEEPSSVATQQPLEENEIERRFAELDALARTKPDLTRRIPPFCFSPLIDMLEGQDELVVEVAVPGVERSDVTVELRGDELTVSGVRRGACGSNGRAFVRAQIPRGPFLSTIRLPYAPSAPAHVEVDRGIISILLQKPYSAAPAAL